MADKSTIGQKISGAAKSALGIVKWLPMLFGSLFVFAVKAPTGRSLIQDAKDMNPENFLYDAKEIFTGVDTYGNIQKPWLKKTYLPVAVGGLVSMGIGWLQDQL